MKTEHVLAIKAEAVKPLMQGKFVEIPEGETLDSLFPPQHVMMGSRAWLETDENFLQLIPYTLVMSRNGQVLAYSRTEKGGEPGLYGKVSVGWGGHINSFDIKAEKEVGTILIKQTVIWATLREITEELGDVFVTSSTSLARIGLLLDPSDEVGRVHLGIIQTLLIAEELENTKHKVTSNDEGITVLGFFDKEYLLTSEKVSLESWSRIALENLK